jgi:membrane-associated phospholipid phosphatase
MIQISLKESLGRNSYFIFPYFTVFLLFVVLLLVFPKADVHLFINTCNSPFLDLFFKWITVLGNGFFTMGIVCLFLFFHFRKSAIILLAFVISGIIVQCLKTTVFSETLRPWAYFEGKSPLHLVEGVYLLSIQSFPSGHSASAFALFLCLATFTSNKLLKFLLFIIASLTAFSRVYLSQHFLGDALAGSLLGLLITLLVIYYLYHRKIFGFLDNSIIPHPQK